MTEKKPLEFTGERFTPECVREIWFEHYHRYAFAKNFVANKNVLDAACGEGYGSEVLARYAKNVTAVDIDEKSISHAQQRYDKDNLTFKQASVTELPFADASFDVIISFETLEHLQEQEQMLAEFNRVLTEDGIIIISTPDKKYYSDETGFDNEFHVKELYKQEFKDLISRHWQAQTWYAQALAFNSVMQRIDREGLENKSNNTYKTDIFHKNKLMANKEFIKPIYYVVIVAKANKYLPQSEDLHLFADSERSVYKHYNKTIKDFIYLANKHNALVKQQQQWLSHRILGKIIKFFFKRDN